ncbi:MAG TPA: hypothetical protein VHC90_02555 [Bryobacteraceae bacterium]|nr:hypothetical protein [Bryobacteraceae bacterium]
MPAAFRFTLDPEETLSDGSTAWVLAAEPRLRTGPLTREAKVLGSMKGCLWVEKNSYRIRHAGAAVTAPVSIFGILARMLPGTRMEFETRAGEPPLLSRYSLTLSIARLWFHSTRQTVTSYWDYRPNEEVMQELLAESNR